MINFGGLSKERAVSLRRRFLALSIVYVFAIGSMMSGFCDGVPVYIALVIAAGESIAMFFRTSDMLRDFDPPELPR